MPQSSRSRFTRRGALRCAAAAFATGSAVAQQPFPSRPIALIVPFPPGGPTDRQARLLAELAAAELGVPVTVENRPGAGGTLGPSSMAASARPDGYTISLYPGGMLRVPHLQKVAWHPIRDFAFICGISANGFGLVVRADAPWAGAAEYLDAARAAPGRIDYGSAGVGTSSHLLMEQLALAAGVRLTHVPYKGASEMMQALIGGHLMSANDASGWEKLVDEGKLRLLLTFGDKPARRWPKVPTAVSLGHAVVANSAHGLVGPAGLPAEVVRVLHDAFQRAMQDARHQQLLEQLNQHAFALAGDEFRRWAERSFEQERQVVERVGLVLR